jgi:hypothetical protein
MKHLLLFLCLAVTMTAGMRTIPAGANASDDALDPAFAGWKAVPPVSLALQRTPPLYSTDAPAALEIQSVQVQLLRGAPVTYVRLEWADSTSESFALEGARKAWVTEKLVTPSQATDRFSDSVAVMIPSQPPADGVYPSLQMGDPKHPVRIFFVDTSRGAHVMEAAGRGTTRRTAQTFPARSVYSGGTWAVTMKLPALPSGTPLSVAVWNGGQQDRDGRKYFTVWYKTE